MTTTKTKYLQEYPLEKILEEQYEQAPGIELQNLWSMGTKRDEYQTHD